ncbi:MAG: addiction module toxin RelE [Candidatus Dadabacteria bacterium]|nr:addiction module toxin RelE [Candidatus Dadabacteria bacterium]NIS07183.1 addiction module toxin RelE [Candidatus Dadabacteria bacterium]NIV41227.1 addiction module toxin RelE [Candidatus Dadabacteria bacterium]NIX14312.1 addiction module toxin RelE [Candidatus Dadabacteria bacterium]NIY20961.1 addiction module toxin RelE [Candidatus Dadabacteria bacterium]
MARPVRVEIKNAVYFISSKSGGRKHIVKDDADRAAFLETLEYVVGRYGWKCHAYCIGDTEYNLAIETPKANLSVGMRQLNGIYTQKFNRKNKKRGNVFQGRFKAVVVEKDAYLLDICRHVVLLPQREGITKNINTFKWSSYRATAGTIDAPGFLHVDWILSQFAKRPKNAQSKYRDFIKEGKKAESPLSKVKGQILLGGEKFIEQMTLIIIKGKRKEDIPKWQRHIKRPKLDEVFKDIKSKTVKQRNKKVKEAHDKYGYTLKEIGQSLGLHYTSISRIINNL